MSDFKPIDAYVNLMGRKTRVEVFLGPGGEKRCRLTDSGSEDPSLVPDPRVTLEGFPDSVDPSYQGPESESVEVVLRPPPRQG